MSVAVALMFKLAPACEQVSLRDFHEARVGRVLLCLVLYGWRKA